jgi:hypothetical protein
LHQGKIQHNFSVKEFSDRAENIADHHLIKHNITESKSQDNLDSAAASQSKFYELGSLVLTSMVKDHGQ